MAFWPFSKKEPYVAKVGDKVITVKEFGEAINKLHTSERVGEALSKEKIFEKQRYRKFLDEMIDTKLMLIEAESMGLDKEADFVSAAENYSLNLFLSRLREDEVVNKVKVEDSEVEAAYAEESKKKEEQKASEGKKEEQKASKKEKVDAAAVGDIPGHKKDKSKSEKEVIKNRLSNEKIKAREAEYFVYVRGRADVKFDDEAIKKVSSFGPEELNTPLSYVNGEPIPAGMLPESVRKSGADKDIRAAVESIILYKLLDKEAAKRGYGKEDSIAKAIAQFRQKRLTEDFKKKAVAAAVKIEENEISDYYAKNIAKYTMQDLFNLGLITVENKAEAAAVIAELKKGASFAHLAEKKSTDSSSVRGGDMGWVSADRFGENVLSAFMTAKEGEVLGPFDESQGKGGVLAIFEFRGMEKGVSIPLEKIKKDIRVDIGRGKYSELLITYLKRIRENTPIEINEVEMSKF